MPINLESLCPYCQHELTINDAQEEIQTCDHVVYCKIVRNHDPFAEGNDDNIMESSMENFAIDKRAENWLCGLIDGTSQPPDCDHIVDASIGDGEGDDEWKGGVIYAKNIDEFDNAAAPFWTNAQKRAN